MGRPADDEQVERLLAMVAKNGGTMGNTSLIDALGWNEEEYWRLRDKALDSGRIVRGRGRGGSVSLVQREAAKPAPEVPIPSLAAPVQVQAREADLYVPCRMTLQTKWREERGLHECHVEITALQGRRDTGGEWTRPDIAALSMRTLTHWPGRFFDVWTFEIKPRWEFGVTGVFEAAAHSRWSTHAYAMFHVPTMTEELETTLDRCISEAQRFQVGLVIFGAADDFSTWDFRVDPVRREPDPALLEQFIATQLSDKAKAMLHRWQK